MADPTPSMPTEFPLPPHLEARLDEFAQTLARGGTLRWEGEFIHPLHGPLTFRGELPKALAWEAHQLAVDRRLGDVAFPSAESRLRCGALAAMIDLDPPLLELPVIEEKQTETEDGASMRIERIRYNPREEVDDWYVAPYLDWQTWRMAVLRARGRLGESSRRTAGSDSSAPSS